MKDKDDNKKELEIEDNDINIIELKDITDEQDKKELEAFVAQMTEDLNKRNPNQKGDWVSMTSGNTSGKNPDYYFNLMCRENWRSGHEVNVTVSWGIKLKGSNSQTYFGYPTKGEFKVHTSYSGWFNIKGNEKWYGGQDYRWYEWGFTINVGGSGSGSFMVQLQQSTTPSTTWNATHSGTFWFTSSNTAPWWTSNDTRMHAWNQVLKQNTIIPENSDYVECWSSTATDNEQGGNLNYDIHRVINGNYSAQLKWGGSHTGVGDHIGGWGSGTEIKYYSKVHDGNGLWAPEDRWSWSYIKNSFTRATVHNPGSMDASNQKQWTMTMTAARNESRGGYHSICSNNFGYRFESLTGGVGVYHNTTHSASNSNNFNWEIYIGDSAPSSGYWGLWIKRSELVNAFRGSNYCGDLRLRFVSWNDYGSTGVYDFNIWVDLRATPGHAQNSRYDGGTVSFKGTNYYLPAYRNFTVRWDHVTQPTGGGNCSYTLYYQIGDGNWVWYADTNNNYYDANMNAILGNARHSKFRFIIRNRTSYGHYSDTGCPYIETHWYDLPTITVTSYERQRDKAIIKGKISINTSIGGVECTSTHWRNEPASGSNTDFTATGSTHTKDYTINVAVNESSSRLIHIASKDTLGVVINPNGSWGYMNYKIEPYLPLISWNKDLVNVNSDLKSNGILHAHNDIRARNSEALYRIGMQFNNDEEFWHGLNQLAEYNNASSNDNVMLYHKHVNDDTIPSNVKNTCRNKSNRLIVVKVKSGDKAPGRGGFYFARQTSAKQVYYFIFEAFIPIGYKLEHHHNAFGDQSQTVWISPQEGTGKWETYICKALCGYSGNFSTIGFFALHQTDGGSDKSFEWYISRATCFEATRKAKNIQINTDGITELGQTIDFHYDSNIDAFNNAARVNCFASNNKNYLEVINSMLTLEDTLYLRKGHEGNGTISQIFFEPQLNDAGRIIHYERDNHSQLWLVPGDDVYSTGGNDEIIMGRVTGVTTTIGDYGGRHWFRMDGAYRSASLNESSHGYQISSKKSEHFNMHKQDEEQLYDYVKDLNIYNYRNISNIKQEQENARVRGDVMLGIMSEEAPLEIVNCDTEKGDEKNIELFSYISMTTGALKQAIKKIEIQETKILELEERLDGITNKE